MIRARAWRQVPFIPQLQVAECGAACIASVLAYHGAHIPLVEVRRRCGISRDGLTAMALAQVARAYHLEVRAVQASVGALPSLSMPAILHWNFNHFVVLESISSRGAVIVNPASGRERISLEALSRAFTGVALSLVPGPAFERAAPKRNSLRRYVNILRQNKGAALMLFMSALTLELLGVLFPAANQVLIDHVIKVHRDNWMGPVAGIVGGAAAARITLRFVRARVLSNLHLALDLSLVSAFTEHMLKLPMAFFEQRRTGDLMQRVQTNEGLRTLSSQLVTALLDGVLILGYAALMLAYDLKLGAMVIALSLGRVLLAAALGSASKQATASELSLRGREQNAALEGLSAPEAVRAFRAAPLLRERHTSRLVERWNQTLRLRRLRSLATAASQLLDGLSWALVLYVGGNAVIDGALTAGVFAGFLTLQGLLREPLTSLLGAYSQYIYVRGIVARIDDVLDAEPERDGTLDPGELRGEIELRNVTFRYSPDSSPICDNVSLRIAPGEKIALVGASGAGKSTLARIMLGLLNPTEGQVLIDGRDLSTLQRSLFRRQAGVVLQEPRIFNDTVRANLTLGEPDIPMARIRQAAALACVDDVIKSLPSGYDTLLGEGGRHLSGGQRQRLAVARALSRAPRLLLLDEATSSLDLETEATLHANLGRLRCTRVVIAHRMATVRDADRIVVLDAGRVVEAGSYRELVRKDGHFARLLSASQ